MLIYHLNNVNSSQTTHEIAMHNISEPMKIGHTQRVKESAVTKYSPNSNAK
jgi:hypothetical protein